MDRDLNSPFSSLVLSSQVFQPSYQFGLTSRFGNDRLSVPLTVNKSPEFFLPQNRSPLNAYTSLKHKPVFSTADAFLYADDGRLSPSGNLKSKYSEHSLKVNKVLKVPYKTENISDLGSGGFISEGTYNTLLWSPFAMNGTQVAGKLVMPNLYNMKATCGQRGSQHSGLVISPTKAAIGNLTDGLRPQHSLSQPLLNGHNVHPVNSVNEIMEAGHYDYLKTGISRVSSGYNNPRERYITVTYKEHNKVRPEKQLNEAAASDPANGVAGDVEYRLRLNDVTGDQALNKVRKNSMPVVDNRSNENSEQKQKNVVLSQKTPVISNEEGSEEFVSRAGTPDDDEVSFRDGDSQAWDDDEEVDVEDDMPDNGDETSADEVTDRDFQSTHVSRVTSAAPELILRDATTVAESLVGSKKQLSPIPLSRVRIAQQEQQKRLRDNIGIDRHRPVTGCAVVFNGTSTQSGVGGSRNRQITLPKRSVTRPPTASMAPTSTKFNSAESYNVGGDSTAIAPFHRRVSNKVGHNPADEKALHALHPSLFSNVPPTLVFGGEDNTVALLPRELRNLLRWRTSTITPNVLKRILSRSNFKLTAKDDVWVGCWAKHMKQDMFRALRDFQKFNHFPASFQIGRKDRLWRNLCAMQARFGRKEYGFFPQTYILPGDYKMLKRVFEESNSRQRWILKPPASARGNGIRLVCSIKQVPKKRPVIVQKYIHQPYLINDSKFDIRLYVYVSCYDPLKAYIYTDGLARFASAKYSVSLRDLPNKFMHLTNYSINKHNSEYESNGDEDACKGHKWSLHALWSHLASASSEDDEVDGANSSRQPVDVDKLWVSIKDIALKTLLASEQHVVSAVKMNVVNRYAVHELFGFDILLDRDLKPWLLEVNISPSLHSDSPLDVKVKGEMLKDLLNLAGYRLPDPNTVRTSAASSVNGGDSSGQPANENICSLVANASLPLDVTLKTRSSYFDPRIVSPGLSLDERSKHSFYTQNCRNETVTRTLLDTLTPDDVRLLVEFEDERSRMGGFEPLFPTTQSHSYLKMMDPPRYYNLLMDSWLRCYGDEVDADGNPCARHEKGLELLDSFCRQGLHLENPTNDWRHQWRPPALGPTLAPLHRSSTSSANIAPTATAISSPSPVASSRQNPVSLHSQSTGSLPTFTDS